MNLSQIVSETSSIQIIATICFFLALVHTFSVKFFQSLSHRYPAGSIGENFFHFLAEIEVVFGLWAAVFILIYMFLSGKVPAVEYLESRSFTEPMLVFVLMTICSTKPILSFAAQIIRFCSRLLPFNKVTSFYISTMIIGPILGSFITEPAAMTVTALILLNHFYNYKLSKKLKYATLGLLFVSISIGGTLTSFAAPPVLMVAQKWGWDMPFMLTHFGWKAFLSILISTLLVVIRFKKEFSSLSAKSHTQTSKDDSQKIPLWISLLHLLFLFLIVATHHHPVVFMSLFLFFLGLAAVTEEYQKELNLKNPLLVGFFLGGLIVLGGMQSWWLSPLLKSLDAFPLYLGSMSLTAITDNAAITYLGSQVEGLSDISKYALVAGSVVGGGLTVIANAPNPAGYSILNPVFEDDGISALGLLKGALIPTLIAAIIFWLL